MPLVQTRGAASAQGFGEFAQAAAIPYIEDVFSCFLYTGTGATQTIINNIDLSGKGGLTWSKDRSAARTNSLIDTVRGATFEITSDDAGQQTTESNGLNQFNSNGYRIGPANNVNASGEDFVSWTFREQAKFFDVLTYTGTGVNRTIAHNLGSVPGCIMVKRTTTYGYDWAVYHRSLANTQYLVLNSTAAAATGATWWNSTTPTSAVFSVGTDASVNDSGATYVAYLFAHDAGGFGLTGTDNVISCGSFTTDGSGNATVSLGYEPQWLVFKPSSGAGNWQMVDNMRGWTANGTGTARLFPNNSGAEVTTSVISGVNATGFNNFNGSVSTSYIYIAIRRGPMKVPTLGTSVFSPNISSAAVGTDITTNFPIDAQFLFYRPGSISTRVVSRLTGVSTLPSNTTSTSYLETASTAAETTATSDTRYFNNTGFQMPAAWSTASMVFESFRRAPGFFDEVCYTGTGSALTVTHNLAAVPELMIVKRRNSVTYGEWFVYTATLGNAKYQLLNTTQASTTANSGIWNLTTPTSTNISVGSDLSFSASPYVAYLFATCAGVSKVGSYTGTGTTLQIDCGFTAGARFVLIKRTDSTGDWYVWDSARGIVAGNDPYLLLNSTAAEVTGTDYVDTYSAGFEISSTAPAAINASAGSFIFLAIA